jgi:hypothetical protein
VQVSNSRTVAAAIAAGITEHHARLGFEGQIAIKSMALRGSDTPKWPSLARNVRRPCTNSLEQLLSLV